MSEELEERDGRFFLPSTGEDVTLLMNGYNFIHYGLLDKLKARVGHDPSRMLPKIWEGTVRQLADYMQLSLADVCAEFGYSKAAIADDLVVETSTRSEGGGQTMRGSNTRAGAKAAGLKELKNKLPSSLARWLR
ncbi:MULTISPECIES: hypothetical protein [unclassified Rathayibacter]|uniref:hypothetical protein n=1 Tax=unclassified Rathayibacter TaxID=2609250 RepID=UPI0011B014AD|nr:MULTISPECIES: hypothetical protein [unclassified Rathayibacter]